MKHLLEIDSVELSFGERRILQGVYLRVERGAVTAVLGHNGCGKSCLMNVLCGALRPQFASMRIDGVWHKRFNCREVRYMPQHKFIPDRLYIADVLRDFDLDMEAFLMWFPDFERLLSTPVGALSGGERRIVECYTILCSDTDFVMLDEPFSQVMPVHIEVLKRLIAEQKARKGILLTDHMYRHVQEIADTIYVLSNGSSHRVASPEDLIRFGYIRNVK